MALLHVVAFALGVVSLTSAMSLSEMQNQLRQLTTAQQFKNFFTPARISDAMSMKPKMTAAAIAKAFRPISAAGAKKCEKGMAMMTNSVNLVQGAMEKMAKAEGVEMKDVSDDDIEEVILPADEEEKEEEIDCSRVRVFVDGIEFQTADGQCNNLEHPEWGARDASLLRLAPADYNGPITIPFGGKLFNFGPKLNNPIKVRGGQLLPGARVISVGFHGDRANNDNDHSYWLMQWGQFLDHDVTLTPTTAGDSKCDESLEGGVPENCFNIKVPSGDPQFDNPALPLFNRKFIPLERSAPSDESHGVIGPREQFNEITSFVDASNVYGADQERQDVLRVENADGNLDALLKTTRDGEGKEALPFSIEGIPNEMCQGLIPVCYLAGDVRASEQTFLTLAHTLWVREHNRIVRVLRKLNEGWSDERTYQEARRIISSVHQHIAFDEYLPNLIGGFVHKTIVPPYSGYDPMQNAGAFNEFSNAAYRMGHSQLRNQLARLDKDYNFLSEITFRQAFFQPHRYLSIFDPNRDPTYDNYVRGLLDRNSQQIDQFISEELNNHLFEPVDMTIAANPTGPGLDLASLNIQRGRDHGLASYLTLRRKAVAALTDLGLPIPFPIIPIAIFKQLRGIYGKFFTLARIDLWVGGLAEQAVESALNVDQRDGGQLGVTFTFIISTQFVHFRNGDRFYYRNLHVDPTLPESPPVLTPQQVASIEATSLSTYICSSANDRSTMKVQPQAFRFPNADNPVKLLTSHPPGASNERLPCSELLERPGSKCLDLSAWANDGAGCQDEWNPFTCQLFFHLGGCTGSGPIGSALSNLFDISGKCNKSCGTCSETPICFEEDLG